VLNDGHEYRLPDEYEWQAAAAGFENREYPWGKWAKDRCNVDETKIGKTSPIGIFQKGNTPEGVADLSGNVWEWTSTDYHSKKNLRDFEFDKVMQELLDKEQYDDYFAKLKEKIRQLPVLRGGSWLYFLVLARCAYRGGFYPDFRSYFVGFRCARTPVK
jgi:formylglycine-generating enzyme required for sulfatase activity